MDRKAPGRPTSLASGAPKFDRLPTRMRVGSSTRPGWVNAASTGLSWIGPPGRKVPTGATADAPGILVAITRASSLGASRAQPTRLRVAVPTAATISPNAVRLSMGLTRAPPRLLRGPPTQDFDG